MVDFTILAITGHVPWLNDMQPHLQSLGGTRAVVAGTLDEACDLLHTTTPRLILVDWRSDGVSCETIDRLLWANSTLARPARVVVVTDAYRADLAVKLFQMGVDEYVSKAEHAGQFQAILGHLLSRELEAAPVTAAQTSPEPVQKKRRGSRVPVASPA
jgi:DNA-binding NarL/FixJ family response regulator